MTRDIANKTRTCLRTHLEDGTTDSTKLGGHRLYSQDIADLENDAERVSATVRFA